MDCPDLDELLAISRARFGIESFHPLQRLAIANVLEAVGGTGSTSLEPAPSNQVVIMPTGAGKSLCFQAPALVLEGPTLVIYPILALMEDQRRRLEAAGLEAAIFRGGQSREERDAALEALRSGRSKIAIANPEVLASKRLRADLARFEIAHLAIDEAHCVSEWGETFRPAYLELRGLAEELSPRATSAFTATASPPVLESMTRRLFGDAPWRLVSGNPDRPNIHWSVIPTLSRTRSISTLLATMARPLVIFAGSRAGVEKIALMIRSRRRDLDLRFYHAGLEADERRAVESWFLVSKTGVLVATSAYGLGVDKKDIRTIVHWELPRTVEAYLQEAGRAGRDGQPAKAVLLLGHDETMRRVRGESGERNGRREAFLAWAKAGGCRRKGLLALLGSAMEDDCAGCDRCDGSAVEEEEGKRQIIEFVRKHSRRWDRRAVVDLLGSGAKRGGGSHKSLSFPVPLADSLAGWNKDEIAIAVGALIELGTIAERTAAPWKGKLELCDPAGTTVSGLASLLPSRSWRGFFGRLVAAHPPLRDNPDKSEESPDDENGDHANYDAPIGQDFHRKIDIGIQIHVRPFRRERAPRPRRRIPVRGR